MRARPPLGYLPYLLLVSATALIVGCSSEPVHAGVATSTVASAATPAPAAPSATPSPRVVGAATPAAPPSTVFPPTPAAASPTLGPTAAAGPAPAVAGDADGAIQTLLDFFSAIEDRDLARAYRLWQREGAASGQSLAEFSRGYADTVRVSVQLGSPTGETVGSARAVTVPVLIQSVVNLPAGDQRVRSYRGSYTLEPSGTAGWQIATARIVEVATPHDPSPDLADPVALVRSYFEAIDRRDFARAYTYWGNLGRASQQTFGQFHDGFATTARVAVDLGTARINAGAGSVFADVPAVVVATQSDGTTQAFCGTYALRRANVPPFNQLGWEIGHANITPVPAVALGSAEARRLLSGGCPEPPR